MTQQPTQQQVNTLIGKTYAEASAIADLELFKLRVTQEDQLTYIVTCDLRFDRVNIVLKEGLIIEASIG